MTSELYQKAIEKFGEAHQIQKSLEEMAECSVALHHFMLQKMTVESVITEIADVMIMMEQLSLIFGKSRVEHFKQVKLERLRKLLEAK